MTALPCRVLLRALLLVLLALVGAPAALAQPAPVCLTCGIASDTIPPPYAIEAGARVGETAIVVWGGAVETDGGVRGILYGRLIPSADTERPQPLTDSNSRPSSFVGVLPVTGGFRIVWNDDRRDAPGLYQLAIDTTGAHLRAAELLIPGPLDSAQFRVVNTSSAATLVWSDRSRRLFVHRLARDGRVLIDRREIGIGSARSARFIGGIDAVGITTDSGLVLIDAHDSVTRSAIPPAVFDGTHFVLRDGGVAWLRDSTAFLAPSPVDAPQDSITLPIPKGSLGLTTFSQTDGGGLQLTYLRGYDTNVGIAAASAAFIRMDVGARMPPQPYVIQVYTVRRDPSYGRAEYVDLTSLTRTQQCSGSAFGMLFTISRHMSSGYLDRSKVLWVYRIALDGAILEGPSAEPENPACQYEDGTVALLRPIRLRGGIGNSSVRVGALTVHAPTAVFSRSSSESTPSVFVERGIVRVGYRTDWNGGQPGFVEWHRAGIDSAIEYRLPAPAADQQRTLTVRSIWGRGVFESWIVGPRPDPRAPLSKRLQISSIGERWSMHSYPSNFLNRPTPIYGVSLDGDQLGMCYREPYGGNGEAAISPRDSLQRWSTPVTSSGWTHLAFVGASRLALLRRDSTSWIMLAGVGVGVKSTTVPLIQSGPIVTALPAGAGRFHLVTRRIEAPGLVIHTIDTTGAIVADELVEPLEHDSVTTALIDPRDTSIVLVATSGDQLFIARADREPGQVRRWAQVLSSAGIESPTGLFVRDTLYLAWTRRSSDGAEVEGIALARHELPEPPPAPPPAPNDPDDEDEDPGVDETLTWLAVAPVPATSMLAIGFEARAVGMYGVSVYDMQGRRVLHEDHQVAAVGPQTVRLDVSGLIDGVHVVRVRGGGEQGRRRALIVHDR